MVLCQVREQIKADVQLIKQLRKIPECSTEHESGHTAEVVHILVECANWDKSKLMKNCYR